MLRREIHLSPKQEADLVDVRDHHPKAYVRERAAAILKVAAGQSVRQVAQRGLLHTRKPETVSEWLDRYEKQGITGLKMSTGRGRKPAFSPKGRKDSPS